MELLLKQVKVINLASVFHNQFVDIHIKNGVIHQIGKKLSISSEMNVWKKEGTCISIGWFDVGTQVCDPGYEHREDLNSVCAAAYAGGFTGIAPYPNTQPAIHSKSEVQYLLSNTRHQLLDFYPIGNISEEGKGKQLAEMYDMYNEGAVAFSDGKYPLQHGGLMMRALLYVKSFDGIVINQPYNTEITGKGYIHEGKISTSLGLRGIASISEEIMVQRDLYLLEYTDSRLHLANISCKKSVALIRAAKAAGLKITASVNPMNLILEDDVLMEFDTNYKVYPPIRSSEDRQALIEGLKDGTIDFIQSNHVPQDVESKNCEFIYAKDGVIMLETAFAACWAKLAADFSIEELIPLFSSNPRAVLGLPIPTIQVGEKANFTLFHPTKQWTYQKSMIQSKSCNSPFIGTTFTGKVLGVINGTKTKLLD